MAGRLQGRQGLSDRDGGAQQALGRGRSERQVDRRRGEGVGRCQRGQVEGLGSVVDERAPAGSRSPAPLPSDGGAGRAGLGDAAQRVKLACRNLWKIFGPSAAEFISARSGEAAPAELEAATLIGAVRKVSLDVREAEIFIVMGLSGSGKSTLLRCLSRLIEPSFGSVTFDGRDLLKASEAELIDIRRHKMGMVFQHFALLPHLTVLDNVGFPLMVQGIDKRVAAALGIPIGLWCSRSNRVSNIVTPIIDTLQTIPSFCFIIPVVMLFRVGDVTALIATVAFAIVPAIRYTNHGIRQVPHDLIEAGIVSRCTKWQLFRNVQLPVAMPEIMLG